MAGEDRRISPSKSLAYGNPTVVQTMLAWAGMGARAAYVYGDTSQVVPTMVTLMDIRRAFGVPEYPVEVATQHLSQMPSASTPEKLLESWYGIEGGDIQSIGADEVLIVLDLPETGAMVRRAVSLMAMASRNNAKVMVVCETGKKVPSMLFGKGRFAGTENTYTNIFGYLAVENTLANWRPEKIMILGHGKRVFTSAVGAMDFLARFDTGGASLRQLAGRVVVDESSEMVGIDTSSVLKLLECLDLPSTDYPLTGNLTNSTDKVLISPV